jgi:predicted NACHT family NTPase
LQQTKRVWAAVAHWMHEETNRGTLHRNRLHQKLVDVLVQRELTEYQAEAEAESYLQTATESTGLLEARGPNIFAFVHQTFQEYLAARHLAIPTQRAVANILGVAGDPRWHEVIRLAVGIIGIQQEKRRC